MIRTAILTLAGALAVASASAQSAQTSGGLNAQCQIMGQPTQLSLQFEAIGGAGIVLEPGVNPGIRRVIADGSRTIYWNGQLSSPQGSLALSGENNFLRFYDPNVINRETVLRVDMTGTNSFTLTDQFGNYPGSHPCRIVQVW